MAIKTFFLLGILILINSEVFSQASWEIDIDKNGVKIYTKNETGSNFKSFKGVMLLEATPDKIIEILKDADGYVDWYGYTKTSKLLKSENDVQFNYVETEFPWPFKNRDMVYKMSIDTSNIGKIVLYLKGVPDYIEEKRGIVRMDKAEGYILLNKMTDSTEITYILHTEPGKGVPARLANRSIAEMPYNTLLGLRNNLQNKDASE